MNQPPDRSHADDHPDAFRAPTPREHRIAALLFLGFGVFFVLLFFVLAGWWFRWVIIVLGIVSMMRGIGHARDAMGTRGEMENPKDETRNPNE